VRIEHGSGGGDVTRLNALLVEWSPQHPDITIGGNAAEMAEQTTAVRVAAALSDAFRLEVAWELTRYLDRRIGELRCVVSLHKTEPGRLIVRYENVVLSVSM